MLIENKIGEYIWNLVSGNCGNRLTPEKSTGKDALSNCAILEGQSKNCDYHTAHHNLKIYSIKKEEKQQKSINLEKL